MLIPTSLIIGLEIKNIMGEIGLCSEDLTFIFMGGKTQELHVLILATHNSLAFIKIFCYHQDLHQAGGISI